MSSFRWPRQLPIRKDSQNGHYVSGLRLVTTAQALATSVDSSPDELIRQHLPLVAHVVRETMGRVPGHVHRDDLTSAGMMALVQAQQAYDPSRGVPFAS